MSSILNYFRSPNENKNNRCIDTIFKNLDKKYNKGSGIFYNTVKYFDMILGGTAVLLDHMTESSEEAFAYGLEESNLVFVVNVSKSEKILQILRDLTTEENNKVARTRIHNFSKSFYRELGINEFFLFDFSTDPTILIDNIEVCVVFDGSPLDTALIVYGYDVLTSYITFKDTSTIKQRRFISSYENLIDKKNPTAHLLPDASQEFYDEKIYPRKDKFKLNFMNESSTYYLQNCTFDIFYGQHTINFDRISNNELLGMDRDGKNIIDTRFIKNHILSGIAESIIYDNRVGFFRRGFSILGISIDEDTNRKAVNSYTFTPHLNSLYQYKNQTMEGLFKLYANAVTYDYLEDIKTDKLYLYNENFGLGKQRYKVVEEKTEPSSSGKVDINSYIRLRYYFDREYYDKLSDPKDRESYMKLSFINHISGPLTYLLNLANSSSTVTDEERKIFHVIYEFSRSLVRTYSQGYLDCCKKDTQLNEEIHMGLGVEPYFDDYLDDECYLNIREFVEKDRENHIIIFLEDGVILPLHRGKLLEKLTKSGEDFVFFNCSSKFDNSEPLTVSYSEVDFTEPYFEMVGSSQELSFRVAEIYSLVFGNVFNFYKLTKEKTVTRIAKAGNISFNGINIVGEQLNIVSGHHCQSGVSRDIYKVSIVDVTGFKKVERVSNTRRILTLEDVFDKYPEAKEIYDSTQPKGVRIRMANRLEIDSGHKNRLIQSISTQIQNILPPVSDSDSESDSEYESDIPEREAGGTSNEPYPYPELSFSDSDQDSDDEPQRELGGIAPMRLDFSDSEIEVLEPQSTQRRPVPDRAFRQTV